MADWAGIGAPAVCNWVERGFIPPGWHWRLDRDAREKGYEIDQGVFDERLRRKSKRSQRHGSHIRQERTQRVTATDALAKQITTVESRLNNEVGAQITQIIQAYTAADTALAQEIDTVASALGENVSSVSVLFESVNGIKSQFTVMLNENGHVVGIVDLSQENGSSSFTVEAAKFLVALTGASGGDPVPVFAIQNVNGSPKLALRGDMIADGSISARHINAATISTLYISDPGNTYYWNFATGSQGRTDGTFLIDMSDGPNRGLDIAFG